MTYRFRGEIATERETTSCPLVMDEADEKLWQRTSTWPHFLVVEIERDNEFGFFFSIY
ncbi:hypothetical protein CsatB_020908 [Cannabis sativa]